MRRADKNRQKEDNIRLANKICDALTEDEDRPHIILDEAAGRQVGKSYAAIKIGKYIIDEMEKKKNEAVAHERKMHALLSKQRRYGR